VREEPVLYCPTIPLEKMAGAIQRILLADYSDKPSALDYLPTLMVD
jgi:hypothetical protein